jgi:hypothetical protein
MALIRNKKLDVFDISNSDMSKGRVNWFLNNLLANEKTLIEIITKKNLDRKGVRFISEDRLKE